jgi:uncharacterized protein YjbI with pentapeptide repeats
MPLPIVALADILGVPWEVFIILLAAVAVLLLFVVPKMQLLNVQSSGEKKGKLELLNDYRQTLVQVFGGIAIVATVYAAVDNASLARESLDLTRQGQIADRTFKALDMLSKKNNMDSKVAAIYALEEVAREDPKSEWQITETLFNYLQVHSSWPPPSLKEPLFLPRDISAVSDFLAKRPYISSKKECLENHQCWDYEKKDRPTKNDIPSYFDKIINLPYLDLRHVSLDGAMLKTANINYSHFEHAVLRGVHLENSYGEKVHLSNADMSDSFWLFANLKEADLRNAQLCRAHLQHVYAEGADLTNADLQGSHWDNPRQFRQSNLKNANLTCTNWRDADMRDLFLDGAKLFGADLRDAHNLTQEQLKNAKGDMSTKLSDEGLRPSTWQSRGSTKCGKRLAVPICQ